MHPDAHAKSRATDAMKQDRQPFAGFPTPPNGHPSDGRADHHDQSGRQKPERNPQNHHGAKLAN
jgi:hypothetical protein